MLYRQKSQSQISIMMKLKLCLCLVIINGISACGVTARMEPYKQTDSVIADGERVVILARKHHATHEAEVEFVDCISNALANGSEGLDVYSTTDFEDQLYFRY